MRTWFSRFLPWVHPGIQSLLLRADGYRSPCVEAHLVRCRSCREEAELLRRAVKAGRNKSAPAPPLDEIFDGLKLRVAAWCSLGGLAPARQARTAFPVHSGLKEAVELYFGKEASRRLQHFEPWDAPPVGLIATAKPLFSAFLGSEAADMLTRRIADAVS